MFLITLIIPKNVDAIEIGFIKPAWLIRAALLEYQPTSGLRILTRILVSNLFALTVEPLPRNKLTTRAIKNNVTRHRKLYLLAVNPTCRGWRCRCRKSHPVPEFVCFFFLFPFVSLRSGPCTTLLRGTGFRRDVAFDHLRRFRLRHTLPTDDVKTRATVESHHDVVVSTAIGCETKIRTRFQLPCGLRRNVLIFDSQLLRLFQHVFRHDVARLDPTFSRIFVTSLYSEPSFFS